MDDYFDNSWIHARFRYRTLATSTGCLEWQGAKSKLGYGQISVNGSTRLCHRVLWEITHRIILRRDQYVCHSCDNPACLNIKHLWIGTAKDNSRDMVEKGRSNKCKKHEYKPRGKGTYKPHCRFRRLTNEQVLDVRNGKEKPSYYCRKYNITNGYVSKIRNMKAKILIK